MQDKFEAARGRMSRDKKAPRLIFNPKKLTVDDRTIVVQRTNDGGYICLGLGSAGQFLRAVGESNAIEKAPYGNGFGDPFLSRLKSAVALAKEYDPDQPRDDRGRWSDGEGTGSTVAGTAAAATSMAIADASSLYGNDAIIPALKEVGARALAAAISVLPEGAMAGAVAVGGAAVVLGTLFLPTNRSSVSDGTLPDAPAFAYHYDHETGLLTVTRQNGDDTAETVFSGHHGTDGVFRDENGNAIGRYLGDSVALDADAINGYEARRKSDAAAQAGTGTQTAIATRSDAKLCPDPGPDKAGYKLPGAIAYQMYVGMTVNGTPLPPGIGIRMVRPNGKAVYLDDCRQATGALIEAKGFGYSKAMNSGKAYPWFRMYEDMMGQASRQLEAARGRPVEWHFAEKDVADYMRKEFAEKRPGITVFYTPPPRGLIGELKRILKGGQDELRYLAGPL